MGTNGPLSYLASDGQGTVSETLDGSGNVTSAQLYTPYGSVRYSSGSSPTSLGYTGQRADGATGLDYYHARYYDLVAGQFISADTVDDGLNRYGYVGGNPTTATDPSGHRLAIDGTGGGGSSTPLDCHITYSCPTPPPPPPPPPPVPTPTPTGCHSDRTCGCYSNCGGGKKDTNRTGNTPCQAMCAKVSGDNPGSTKEQIAAARADALKERDAFGNIADTIQQLINGLISSGFWAWIQSDGIGYTITTFLNVIKDLAQVLSGFYAWQAGWDDSTWTVTNVLLFQAGLDALVDAVSIVEAVVGGFILVELPGLLKSAGAGLVIAGIAQLVVYNTMIQSTSTNEGDDLGGL